MHGSLALGVSVGKNVAEPRSGLGVGGAGTSTGTGSGSGALSCVAVALMKGRGMLVYSSVCFPVPTLFLAAPLALDRMITVAGTESYTIAQTLESPLLFQRLFPADWSTILLSNNALNFPFTMEVFIRAPRARPTAGPNYQALWEAQQVWRNRLLLYVLGHNRAYHTIFLPNT